MLTTAGWAGQQIMPGGRKIGVVIARPARSPPRADPRAAPCPPRRARSPPWACRTRRSSPRPARPSPAPTCCISSSPRAPSSPMPVMMMPTPLAPDAVRRGAEQHVDRRAVARHQRTVLDRDVIARAAALQQHVAVAGRDQRAAAQHGIAVGGLLDLHLAQAVEAARERRGELLRHVLHDDDARACDRQRLQHVAQRLRAAGGGADADHPLGGARHRLAGHGRRQHHVGGELARRRRPTPAAPSAGAAAAPAPRPSPPRRCAPWIPSGTARCRAAA